MTHDADSCVSGRLPAVSVFRARVRRFLQQPGTADLGRYRRLLPAIAAREEALRDLPDEELTSLARAQRDGARDDAAFCALGREAARRALGERPYDVQLVGTLVMLSGHIAEMATGELSSPPTTCSWSARWSCCPGISPRWRPARGRPCPARWRPPGTRQVAGRYMCRRSTTTWPAGTPRGCAPSPR